MKNQTFDTLHPISSEIFKGRKVAVRTEYLGGCAIALVTGNSNKST